MNIVLFTDFGSADLYVGQVKGVLARLAPTVPVIDLLHDVPAFDIEAGAHLLAALSAQLPPPAVFLAVIDPGVGGSRPAAVVLADGRWYVGPDNGLMSVVASRARERSLWHIRWRPENLSASFHARDLFAPIAARLAHGQVPTEHLRQVDALDVRLPARALERVIYLDHYGNAFTGIPAAALPPTAVLEVNGQRVEWAATFSAVPLGQPFWYANSIGLVEIAVNQGSAARTLGLTVGSPVRVR